jgi:hypothetical protein
MACIRSSLQEDSETFDSEANERRRNRCNAGSKESSCSVAENDFTLMSFAGELVQTNTPMLRDV